jgi:cytochrome b6-f complex iron-sulfur subunit
MSEQNESTPRRDFLSSAAYWTTAGTLGFAALGMARMPMPGVLPGPASAIKIGPPGEYPVSEQPIRVPDQNLYILHSAEGFAALAAVCTHLGCIVSATPSGFACPCHGSQFSREGAVVKGPAPSPLVWYELSLAADGQMVVDTRKPVPMGTRFALS